MTAIDRSTDIDQEAEQHDVNDGFSVTDQGSANWLVRKIVNARDYRKRVERWAEQEIARAEREEAFFFSRFGGQLEQWVRRHLSETGSRKRSVNLPAGRVGLRAVGPSVVVEDSDAVITWARTHCPQAIEERTTVRIIKRHLNEHVEQTGELPEQGVTVRPAGDRLVVK